MVRAVAWQAMGSAATLVTPVFVAWRWGLGAQGEFGLAKSWFDAAAVIAALGLPQGLLFLLYQMKVPALELRGWLLRAWACLNLVALALAWYFGLQGHSMAALATASAPLGAAHLVARSLLLHKLGGVAFGWATALPGAVLLLLVLGAGIQKAAPDFGILLVMASVAALIGSLAAAWPRGRPEGVSWSRRALWAGSLHAGVQQAAAALLVAALLTVVAFRAGDAEALGALSLGLLVYQSTAVLAGYAAPLLFDRLARAASCGSDARASWARLRRILGGALLLAGPAGLIGILAYLVAPGMSAQILILIAASVAAAAARLAATALLAEGRLFELSAQALLRLGAVVGLALLAVPALAPVLAAGVILLLVELSSCWHCLRLIGARGV